jgi:hypothetical protein
MSESTLFPCCNAEPQRPSSKITIPGEQGLRARTRRRPGGVAFDSVVRLQTPISLVASL